jgi:O-antigen/teichoic acid export membrane protein
MATTRVFRESRLLSRLLADEGLTKKAYLNAVAAALDYAVQIVVAFIVTPWMVAGLGDYFYGVWQMLTRLVGTISPASGRPTQALKSILANQQASTDYELKRRYVGGALAVWALFLPFLGVLGGILVWFVPFWLNIPAELFWQVRATILLLFTNLVMLSVAGLPQAVLQGENLGYKRMGLSALLVLVGGGLTGLALFLGMGIIGAAAAALTGTLLTGLLFVLVARAYTPWFGVARPSSALTRQFLGTSAWFMGWNLIMNLMTASDVVVLGLLNSVESVTSYTLTKYAPETVVGLVATIVFGITPGLGGMIGTGDHERAAQVRGEIMALTWLALCSMGSAIVLWNRAFLGLWVGPGRYAGAIPGLLIVLVSCQFVLIRNDAAIIDVTLRLRNKVLFGGLSVALTLIGSIALVGYFKLGIVGLCIGLIAGRTVLSIGYPVLVGRYLGVRLLSQLKGIVRPGMVMILLFAASLGLEFLTSAAHLSGLKGWIIFIVGAGTTAIVALLVAFGGGLSGRQRQRLVRRTRAAIGTAQDRSSP